ncbi:Acetyltransferase (GNAT) family [Popillia japonica]|uniref:aralkylamine N-acetyltransferase n=1 Tax=Popillia japonica TaxID=7064 RepID=A0AAW1MUF1_POPJA
MALIPKLFPFNILKSAIKPVLVEPFVRYKSRKGNKNRPWPYVILRPDRESYDEILDIMWNCYFKDEPIVKSLGLGNKPNNIMDQHIMKSLSQGLSLIARCKYDGCIVGAVVNEGTCPWDPDIWDRFACTLCNVKLRQLYQFYAYLQRLPNLWNLACTQKIFEIAHLCVKHEERGKGLATALVRQAIETGADCGYSCIRVDATAIQTQKICERLKMKLVYDVPYCTYIGSNNKPVINPAPPDTSCKIYVATPLLPKR